MKASSSKEATHTFLVIEANAIWGFHNIGASQAVNDHVVDRTCSDPRQVCVERKLAVRVGHQTLAEHRQDDELSIRQDAEATGRVVLELRVLFTLAGGAET